MVGQWLSGVLAWRPFALWPLASLVCFGAAAGALAMERFVPPRHRRIPGGMPAEIPVVDVASTELSGRTA